MGDEIGRIRPTNVFERPGESRMTPPASSISSQVTCASRIPNALADSRSEATVRGA